ncbi:HalOD1 output domain-containing protein [Halobacteriaceae archaeon SHR40]|uniref:HalOD1 output domain-containing protein n=1 Tax=Halovenus amylolytica TaxID=2500550 RepID=UPI000FE336B5
MNHDGPHSHRRDGQTQQVVSDWRQSDGLTEAIVKAIAEVTDSQPMALPPLQEYTDVDSLKRLLTGTDSIEIRFEYEQVRVTIASDGKLVVELAGHR